MNYSEVQELLKAGFNAQEIREMLNPQNPQDNPQPDPDPEVKPEPEIKPEEPEVKPEPDESKFSELNNTMNKILKAIQNNNLQNSSFNKQGETDINTEVDKIMGSLIRPEHEKGDK